MSAGYDLVTFILMLVPVVFFSLACLYWSHTGSRINKVYDQVNGIAAGLLIGCWGAVLLLIICVKLGFWPK